jgi:SAM-dependent methyltransferase
LSEFDRYASGSDYRDEVAKSIGFSGASPDLFVAAKARLLVDLAARLLGDPKSLAALDVGCGVGETDRFLEGAFARLHGVDVARDAVAAAAERNAWAGYDAYSPGDPIPVGEGEFDIAFAVCVIHHVPPPDWERFVAEMRRSVRPGGIVAVFEHNPYNPLTRKAVSDCEFDAEAVLLSRRRTLSLLAGAGLERIESPYILFFPREGERLRKIERGLAWLPFGAQYYVAARRPG